MIRKLVRRPSPATVIASLALFVSLSGVSYGVATGFIDSREIRNETIRSKDLRNNSIRTQDLRNNEVRGGDVRNSTITGRDVALNSLGGQDIDESKLGKIGDADSLDGVDSAGFLRPDGSGFAPIPGATGTPAPEYNVDPLGYVHLRGAVDSDAGVLPPGARPANISRFAASQGDGAAVNTIEIAPSGAITENSIAGESLHLDGVTFAAGG